MKGKRPETSLCFIFVIALLMSQITFGQATATHFQISEEKELQFRSEFFNLFNNVNLAPPMATTRRIFDNSGRLVGSPGTITQTTTSSRQIQFGLKFIF